MVGYLIYQMPGLIPIALGVMPAYWIMKVSMNRYTNLHRQEEKHDEEDGPYHLPFSLGQGVVYVLGRT